MPSVSLTIWTGKRCRVLDEIECAHHSIGGSGRGRRFATLQVNCAYAMLQPSQFQAFCRDLHTECAGQMVASMGNANLRRYLHASLVRDRKLDRGNPNPGNIGSDFSRFGLVLWDDLSKCHPRTSSRKRHLEDLNEWRNAIAHDDFSQTTAGGALHLRRVTTWRNACEKLAISIDETMFDHLRQLNGVDPL